MRPLLLPPQAWRPRAWHSRRRQFQHCRVFTAAASVREPFLPTCGAGMAADDTAVEKQSSWLSSLRCSCEYGMVKAYTNCPDSHAHALYIICCFFLRLCCTLCMPIPCGTCNNDERENTAHCNAFGLCALHGAPCQSLTRIDGHF